MLLALLTAYAAGSLFYVVYRGMCDEPLPVTLGVAGAVFGIALLAQ